MTSAFQRVTEARAATSEAIATYARLMRDLERIRHDRAASAENVFDAAQACRRAEAEMNEAIERECRAIVMADAAAEILEENQS